MESKNKEEFIALRKKLGKEKLRVAQELFDKKFYRDSISRSYYAMYHFAKAILVTKNKNPYTHNGVKIMLSKEFVKHKILNKEIYRMFLIAKERREDADYEGNFKVTKKEAEKTLKNTETFIKECLIILKKYN